MLMSLRRLVWWKCLFWIALGCGCGYPIGMLRPEPGPPAGGVRVAPERLVTYFRSSDPKVDSVKNVVLYPQHGESYMITFDLIEDSKPSAGFAFGNMPFLMGRDLQNDVTEGQRIFQFRPTWPTAVYGGRLKDAANYAIADVMAQPKQKWASIVSFLDQMKTAKPGFSYTKAWWTENWWRYDVPIVAGGVVVGALGSVLTRRSAADVAAADALRNTRVETAAGPAGPSAEDLGKVADLDALLSARLAGDTIDDENVTPDEPGLAATAGPAVVKLSGGPLEALPEAPKEDKSYDGEFYPTVRRPQPKGFSLVELLVAIGIIGVLIAILLPAMVGARRSSNTILCASNLRSVGQGLMIYLAQNRDTFPPAYLYIGHKIENGVQTPTSPSAGYVHWSSYLYGNGDGSVAKSAFTCPAMHNGGLPPTNTPPENRDGGQVCPSDTVVDLQAPRLAFTVNEVLCPRNKFISKSFGADRIYRFVKATEVASASATILGTEMIDNALDISYNDGGTGWIMSHRPISAFVGLNGELDMYLLPVGEKFRPVNAADLDADPNTVGSATRTRLDLVGRNHGQKVGYPDGRLSNFLYVDGHLETKSVTDTVQPYFEWGDKFYSLMPNNDQVPTDYVEPAVTP